jgi:hypothetical protein
MIPEVERLKMKTDTTTTTTTTKVDLRSALVSPQPDTLISDPADSIHKSKRIKVIFT